MTEGDALQRFFETALLRMARTAGCCRVIEAAERAGGTPKGQQPPPSHRAPTGAAAIQRA
jgi:hypothetical protein